MRRKIGLLGMVFVIGMLVACTKEEEIPTTVELPDPLTVELTVTEVVDVNETVEMEAIVTLGDEKIEDADEVVFEVWEEGNKPESVMIDSVNEKDGVYTAETSFEHDGIFHIQVHVTARAQHTMPVKEVTVGHGGDYVESEGHHYHTEGFAMHFINLSKVESGDEVELVVHLELEEAPFEKARVRYEIWSEGNPDKHDWEPAEETAPGEYKTSYTFSEKDTYTIVIHVEDDGELHEHEEHQVEVE